MKNSSDAAPTRSFEAAAGTVLVFADRKGACESAAGRIAATIRQAYSVKGSAVLGLATGATPVDVYQHLVRWHRSGQFSFREVSTYNLDEYYAVSPLHEKSYQRYMYEHLFAHVDLAPERAHMLDGTVPRAFVSEACAAFERWIQAEGGLDLQLLGIGRNGHIGFNEPCESTVDAFLSQRTRLVNLHPTTLHDAARDFDGNVDAVPREALTMGVATILSARKILILAFGEAKSQATSAALNGPVTAAVPASLLQTIRERVVWLVDEAAIG